MLENISPALSRRIVLMLEEDGMPPTEIARQAGTTVAFLHKVKAGHAALKQKHIENLDDLYPDLPFRIGRELVKENFEKITAKGKKTAKQIQAKGEQALEGVGNKLRSGAWSLLNKTLGDD